MSEADLRAVIDAVRIRMHAFVDAQLDAVVASIAPGSAPPQAAPEPGLPGVIYDLKMTEACMIANRSAPGLTRWIEEYGQRLAIKVPATWGGLDQYRISRAALLEIRAERKAAGRLRRA